MQVCWGGKAPRATLAALAARLTSGGYGGGAPAALKRSAPEGGSSAPSAAAAAPPAGEGASKRAKREGAASAHESASASTAAAPSASATAAPPTTSASASAAAAPPTTSASASAAAAPRSAPAAVESAAVLESEGALGHVDVFSLLGSVCISCGGVCGEDAKLRLAVIGEVAVAFPGIGMAERIGGFVGFMEPPWSQCGGAGCDKVLCHRYVLAGTIAPPPLSNIHLIPFALPPPSSCKEDVSMCSLCEEEAFDEDGEDMDDTRCASCGGGCSEHWHTYCDSCWYSHSRGRRYY